MKLHTRPVKNKPMQFACAYLVWIGICIVGFFSLLFLSLSLSLSLALSLSLSLSLALSLSLSVSLSFIPTYTSTTDRCYTKEFKLHSSPEREFHVHCPSPYHSQPHPSAQRWKWLPERQPHTKDAQPPWLPQCCRLPCTCGKYTIIVRLAEFHPKRIL